tara:strand:+ start:42 stop:374 length:333 start_codon:yes stop_codon:yes gene_type:complete
VTTESEILLLSTTSTRAEAESLGRLLIEKRFVACVNIIPHLMSIFLWEDSIATEEEVLLLMKSTMGRFEDIEKFIKEHHSYSVPEIIAVPILKGSREYLSWIHEMTSVTP